MMRMLRACESSPARSLAAGRRGHAGPRSSGPGLAPPEELLQRGELLLAGSTRLALLRAEPEPRSGCRCRLGAGGERRVLGGPLGGIPAARPLLRGLHLLLAGVARPRDR